MASFKLEILLAFIVISVFSGCTVNRYLNQKPSAYKRSIQKNAKSQGVKIQYGENSRRATALNFRGDTLTFKISTTNQQEKIAFSRLHSISYQSSGKGFLRGVLIGIIPASVIGWGVSSIETFKKIPASVVGVPVMIGGGVLGGIIGGISESEIIYWKNETVRQESDNASNSSFDR
jgi:hypothetical protein